MRTNFRDCQAWREIGLELSTTNNEACKLYDAAISQYVGWYDDVTLGGLDNTLKKISEADQDFVMGRALNYGLTVMGTGVTPRLDSRLASEIANLVEDSKKLQLTAREKMHVEAVKLFSEGFMTEAAQVWEEILLDHPTDMLAVKFAHDSYFYLGDQIQIKDSVSRVMPYWKSSYPLYSYLYGMLAFGEVENNFYDRAMNSATKGLELNRKDAWAVHAVAHVLEMKGQQDEGIKFMEKTVSDWDESKMLARHNRWHWALYNIEKGDYESALSIYDQHMAGGGQTEMSILDIVDLASLLYRLELEGVQVQSRWNEVFELSGPHLDDHITTFNDAHFLISCMGAKKEHSVEKLLNSARDFMKQGKGTNNTILETVGLKIMEALVAYNEGEFQKTVELLYPIRYKIVQIGGSNAQRDLFNLVLLHAAIKSPLKRHNNIARALASERKALRENSPMTNRIAASIITSH